MKPITAGLTLLAILSSALTYNIYLQEKDTINKDLDNSFQEDTSIQNSQIAIADSPFQDNNTDNQTTDNQTKELTSSKTTHSKTTSLPSQEQSFESNDAFDEAMQNMFENSSASEPTEHYHDLIARQPEYIDGNISQEKIVCSETSCMLSVYFVDETSLERFMQSFTSSSKHPIISHTLIPIEGRANLVFNISES